MLLCHMFTHHLSSLSSFLQSRDVLCSHHHVASIQPSFCCHMTHSTTCSEISSVPVTHSNHDGPVSVFGNHQSTQQSPAALCAAGQTGSETGVFGNVHTLSLCTPLNLFPVLHGFRVCASSLCWTHYTRLAHSRSFQKLIFQN